MTPMHPLADLPNNPLPNPACLVLWIDTSQKPPVVRDAGVYSEERPTSMDMRIKPVVILRCEGPSFESAKIAVVKKIESDSLYDFVLSLDTYRRQRERDREVRGI